MAKFLARSCPKCAGYFGVVVSELPHPSPISAVSGWCQRCDYEIAWALIVKTKAGPLIRPLDGSYETRHNA